MLFATKIGGRLCGILTLLFVITDSALIGFFAQTSYHTLTSFFLLIALYLVFATELRHRHVLAMVACSCLFFPRTLMMPLIPIAMLYLLWREKNGVDRLAIVAAAIAPPLAFFLYDQRHLKLLAYVPLLSASVRSYGYQSPMRMMTPLRYDPDNTPLGAVLVLLRWSNPSVVPALALGASAVALALRRRDLGAFFSSRAINVTIVVAMYLSVMHLLGSRGSWTGSVGYIASFGILGAILLGFGFATLIEHYGATPGYRRGLLLSLPVLFLLAPLASPPPALPSAVSWNHPATRAFASLANALRRTIPADAQIFNLGATQTLYAAGLTPYLRQNFGFNTLSSMLDDRVRRRSGLWGEPEIQEWLGHGAD